MLDNQETPKESPKDPLKGSSGETGIGTEKGFFKRIWRYFLSGILVAAPIGLTVYIVWIVVTTIDTKAKEILPATYFLGRYLPGDISGMGIPGIGIITAFLFFTLIGFITAGFFGRFLVRVGENLLARMPFVRGIYSAVKQIVEAVFKRDKNSFREVVLLEYPRKGIWSIGFVTGVTKGEVQNVTTDQVVNVFIPTTPNPTSGFLLFVPRLELTTLTMTIEEGLKMVVSGGIITPTYREALNKADAPAGSGKAPVDDK